MMTNLHKISAALSVMALIISLRNFDINIYYDVVALTTLFVLFGIKSLGFAGLWIWSTYKICDAIRANAHPSEKELQKPKIDAFGGENE